jgi:geranylgeranyl diphosphate synthase type II
VNNEFSLKTYLKENKEIIDRALDEMIPIDKNEPAEIFRAVRYSLMAGGKRIRPILCMAAVEAVGGDTEAILPTACALEMIHTYSLIHDDLPAMDNDDFRRGIPTLHKVFGEDMAILAGDALLTEAFHILTDRKRMPNVPAEKILDVANEIAEASGYYGMVGGQVQDIRSEGEKVELETLHAIHRRKTGALLRASLRAGAILAGAEGQMLADLSEYGAKIGLAFQIADDILNVEGDPDILGKGTGSDAARGKATFPSLMGIEASRARARGLIVDAVSALVRFDNSATPLRAIAGYVLERRS